MSNDDSEHSQQKDVIDQSNPIAIIDWNERRH